VGGGVRRKGLARRGGFELVGLIVDLEVVG
jgi:hypothetical protein